MRTSIRSKFVAALAATNPYRQTDHARKALKHRTSPVWATLLAALLVAGAIPVPVVAGYPEPVSDYVNDFAGVMEIAEAKSLERRLRKVEFDTGIEIVVVTVPSMSQYDSISSIENFSQGLFNHWGVGHAGKNDGVMILVAIEDRQCRIQLGSGYGSELDKAGPRIIRDAMLPQFRQREYSRGIYAGTMGLVDELTREVTWMEYHADNILLAILAIATALIGISLIRSGRTGFGWAFLAGSAVLIWFLLRNVLFRGFVGGFGGGDSDGGGFSGDWDFGGD